MTTIIEDLNKSFNELSQNYIEFCSKFAFNKSDISNDAVLVNELMTIQASINDLVIQLQNMNYKIDMIKHEDKPLDIETNNLINKTMKEMMPLFFCALMNNDKNSILKDNKFMQSAITTMEKLSTPQKLEQKFASNTNVDDVD